ncbi:MAG: methylmalonyl Co-A mutase-associated GTPase MeaB, partial [Acidobacteria bacterium]|nr:methylmalonyl Co-A mutase-associated GTPase MeaB [Acidobacteriota bacterium]
DAGAWRPPVLKTRAATGDGVPAVVEAVERFEGERGDSRERRRSRARSRLMELLQQQFVERLERQDEIRKLIDDAVERMAAGEIDPYAAAAEIMERAS